MTITESTLVPEGGGDPIPLVGERLTIGRRESCDICLNFPNISGRHCELTFQNGYWLIKDSGSSNGIKVNGQRYAQPRPLRPGDEIAIANRKYKIHYELDADAERSLEQMLDRTEDILSQSLMERAGLVRSSRRSDDD